MIFIRYILILLSTLLLSAETIHEDAEGCKVSRWNLMNTHNTIICKLDANKKSHILEFLAKGHNFAYELKLKKQNKKEYWLSWDMNFREDFVIIIALDTNRGQHYLVYTSGEGKSYMHYGLGRRTKNGTWQTIRRNLQKDISYFDNRVQIISVKSFVLRGHGKLDNIMSMNFNDLSTKMNDAKANSKKIDIKKNEVAQNKVPKNRVPKNTSIPLKVEEKQRGRKIFKAPIEPLPIIKLKGAKTVKLELGEDYVEAGVSAYDGQDGEIDVVSIENIDVNQNGRYMILYMATDSNGNVALDKRYVEVGELKKGKDTTSNKRTKEPEEEPEEIDEGTKERNMQMEIWEKKLELKELKLKQKR